MIDRIKDILDSTRLLGKALRFVAVTGTAIFLFAGCSRDEAVELSPTEKLRLQLDPRVGAFMFQSNQAFNVGEYNLALTLTDSVEKYQPDLADLHFMRGRIYTQVNQLDVAQVSFQRALQLDPEYAGASYSMGVNAVRVGLLDEAIAFFQNELTYHPDDLPYLELGRTYAKLGNPDSAKIAYENALDIDSTNTTVHMWYGQLLEEIGELEEALKYTLKGLSLDPDNLDYKYLAGTLYYRLGDVENALKYLEPVAGTLKWHQGAQYNFGQVLRLAGRGDESAPYLAQADSAQQMQQALNEAENAIGREPENRDHWVHLSNLLQRIGDLEKAIESYKVAITLDPKNFAMHNNLATMLIANGDFDEGVQRYQAILKNKPELVDIWVNLGVAYANNKQYNEARFAWENALERDPKNQNIKAYLKQLDQIEKTSG